MRSSSLIFEQLTLGVAVDSPLELVGRSKGQEELKSESSGFTPRTAVTRYLPVPGNLVCFREFLVPRVQRDTYAGLVLKLLVAMFVGTKTPSDTFLDSNATSQFDQLSN